MIKHVVLTFGYVESYLNGFLIFTNLGEKFPTAKETLESLSLALFEKMVEDHRTSPDISKFPCCKATQAVCGPNANYCVQCGASLKQPEIAKSEFIDFIQELYHRDVDSWGENPTGWDPSPSIYDIMKSKPSEVLAINESAAEVLAEFLPLDKLPEKWHNCIRSWGKQHVRPNVQTLKKRFMS